MKKIFSIATPLAVSLLGAGCAGLPGLLEITQGPAKEVGYSAGEVDQEAKVYYEAQIMDNLVRASNGQFFVQTDLNDIGAVIGWKLAGNIGGGRSAVSTGQNVYNDSRVSTIAPSTNPVLGPFSKMVGTTIGLMATATSAITRNVSASISPEHDNTLTMDAAPVVQDPNIANYYVKYLNLSGPTNRDIGITSAEKVQTLYHRDRGFDLPENDPKDPAAHYPLSLGRVPGGKSDLDKVSGGYVPFAWKTLNIDPSSGKKEKVTYYIPKAYSNNFFQLCEQVISRVPTAAPKGGGGGGGSGTGGGGINKSLIVP